MYISWDVDGLLWVPTKMFKIFFWMKALGHKTAKRTVLYSNSVWLSEFSFASKLKKGALSSDVKTTDSYVSKAGTKRYKGNANLKSTQLLAWNRDLERPLETKANGL